MPCVAALIVILTTAASPARVTDRPVMLTELNAPSIHEATIAAPSMQKAMDELRRAVVNHHTLITHRRLSPRAASTFAAEVRNVAKDLVDVAVLDETNRVVIDSMVAALITAAGAIDGTVRNRGVLDGLSDIVTVLDNYPKRFSHPGWRGLQDNFP